MIAYSFEQLLNRFFFEIYPYICITVFFVGSWLRFDREQFTWRSGSSEMLRKRQLVIGSNLFHVSALALTAGHVMGMLTPMAVFEQLGISVQMHALAEFALGGLFGLVCFVGTTILLHRRLFDRRILRASSWSDVYILAIIWFQLGIGLATLPFSWSDHRSGLTLLHAGYWAQRLITFQGNAWELILPIPFVYKLHIVLGLTILLLTPFTRLVHIFSAPIWYLGRGSYQIVRIRHRKSERKEPAWRSV